MTVSTFDDMTLSLAQRSPASSIGTAAFPRRAVERWTARHAAACRRAQACFTASAWAGRSLVDDYGVQPERVHVVGLGRNVEPLPVVGRSATPRFLFVGRDWRRKGGDDLLRAFGLLRARRPAAHLDVVGDHPRLDMPGVAGHGPLSLASSHDRGQLQALYAQATCFVLPSRFEPFGIAYVEAAAAGLPIVATTQGGGAEALGGGCRTVEPGDGHALLVALDELSEPATARHLGEAARRAAAGFTWTATARRVLDVLGLADEARPTADEARQRPARRATA
jgi:glycosyltransferase involved in cell wall biosynthesis